MSFIERALEKARTRDGQPADRRAAVPERRAASAAPAAAPQIWGPLPVINPKPPVPRQAAAPQLQITDAMLQESGLRAPAASLHQQAAEYRHIKRQLITRMKEIEGENRRLILVTSALAGDGKTYSAANLALSLALERDYAVLLVDADVIRPSASHLFGITERPGLMDAVADQDVDVESLVLSTNIEGFSVLPAGKHHANATEYFASARMRQVLADLMGPPNRIVVLDTLPLLLTTEARALVPAAGQVLMVVRAEVTPQAAVMQALELLDGASNVSLMLNAVQQYQLGKFYPHGYHYSYTYGEEKTRE